MNGPIDECVADLKTVVKAWEDQAADVIDIKISKFGGLTKVFKDFFLPQSVFIFCIRKNTKCRFFQIGNNVTFRRDGYQF